MSLIQLLSVGKALSSAKDEPSPYRMAQKFRLPDFGPRRAAKAKLGLEPIEPLKRKPAAVQDELSLDRVRVLRNDLHEEDLELFQARSGRNSTRREEAAAGSGWLSAAGWTGAIRRLLRAAKISS